MNKDQQLRLECLRIAGGDQEKANGHVSFVKGARTRSSTTAKPRLAKASAPKKTAERGKKAPSAQAA